MGNESIEVPRPVFMQMVRDKMYTCVGTHLTGPLLATTTMVNWCWLSRCVCRWERSCLSSLVWSATRPRTRVGMMVAAQRELHEETGFNAETIEHLIRSRRARA